MMKTTYAAIKSTVQATMPEWVTYTQAAPLKRGNGRHKVKVPRRIGVSADNLFSVEMLGRDDKITKVSFMGLARPDILERNLKTIRAFVADVYPADVDWLTERARSIQDNERDGRGNIELTRIKLEAGVPVLFVHVTI